MRQTVFVLPLVGGLKLIWSVGEMSLKFPVIEDGGKFRPVNNKADNFKLLDVLDAVMAERRASAYPSDGARKNHPRVVQMEVEMDGNEANWQPMQWGDIVFTPHGIDLAYYQKCIDDARHSLA